MDGFKRIIRYSLQARLSLWLSLGLIGTALVAGLLSFLIAFVEANRIQDDQLRQMAMLVNRYDFSPDTRALKYLREDLSEEEALISVQILGRTASTLERKAYKYLPELPVDLPEGFQTIQRKKEWRVFVLALQDGQRLAVAQRTAYRDEIAFASAMRTLVPLLLLVPILSVMVLVIVRRMLRPVIALAGEVDRRTQHDLTPLDTNEIPVEIRAFALSINRLLARVTQVLEMQRRFVADAAHELRSPLTALSLQIQSVDVSALSEEAKERIAAMTQGMERTIALLGQLLSLARSQSKPAADCSPFAARKVLHGVLEELMPLAESKHIDLGIVGDENPQMAAVETDFFIVARNLVDNALKYTPAGGRVDVALAEKAEMVCLKVTDTGVGIPADERTRVFDPFYRIAGHDATGSGLGLSIVKTVVERTGGTIHLSERESGTGLQATVCFPKRTGGNG